MQAGDHKYDWIDGWAKTPDTNGWAHHGVAVSRTGDVISFHSGDPNLLILRPDGEVRRTVPTALREAHGITLVEEDGVEFLWVADCGVKMVAGGPAPEGWELATGPAGGQVVKMTLSGEVVLRLPLPPAGDPYAPTWVAVDERRFGGSGDVWVADGYGQSLLHRFDSTGAYVDSLDGGDNRFNCPHAIFIDRRRPDEPRLLVADRSNARVQVLDLDGHTLDVFGADFLVSPSVFATFGQYLIIGELHARLTVVDGDNQLVAYLGRNDEVCTVDGWPNVKDETGRLVRSHLLEPGKFNSPHGMAVDADGSLYVAEWLIGGRFTKLERS